MNKLRLLSVLTVFTVVSALYLTSCKDDDDPEPRAKVSFSSANISVNEDQGDLPVTVVLDRALNEDVVVEYSISGSATRRNSTNAATADYQITGTIGEVLIPKGQTSGTINISILNDGVYEDDETIVLTIDDVDSDLVDFGERTQLTITIVSDDLGITASFPSSQPIVVKEAEREVVEIKVSVSPAPTSDMIISYELSAWFEGNQLIQGVAIDSLRAAQNEVPPFYYDYYIDGVSGEVSIPAGGTTGTIRVVVLSDFSLENDEKIEITLKATPGVTIASGKEKATIHLKQEDCRIVALLWEEGTDVDMDLFVWAKTPTDTDWFLFDASVTEGSEPAEEYIIIPSGELDRIEKDFGITSLEFGGTYIYYSGTQDPLNYRVGQIEFANDDFVGVAVSDGSFALTDINEWERLEDIKPANDENWAPMQTWTYDDGVFGTPTDITNPAGRMGIKSKVFSKDLMKRLVAPQKTLSDLRTKSRRIKNQRLTVQKNQYR